MTVLLAFGAGSGQGASGDVPPALKRARTAAGNAAILSRGSNLRIEGTLRTSYGGSELGTQRIEFAGASAFRLDQMRPVLGSYRLSLTGTVGTLSTKLRPAETPITAQAMRNFVARWARSLFIYTLQLPTHCSDKFIAKGAQRLGQQSFDVVEVTGPCLPKHVAFFDAESGRLMRLEYSSRVTSGGFSGAAPPELPNPVKDPGEIVRNHVALSDYARLNAVVLPTTVRIYESEKLLEEVVVTSASVTSDRKPKGAR